MYLAISTAVLGAASVCLAMQLHRTSRSLRLEQDCAASYQQTARNYERAAHDYQEAQRRTELLLHEEQDRNHDLLERCGKLETALRESDDTACRLRQELQTERRKFKELQEELDSTKDAHDAAISAMWSARNEVDNLKQENGKLTEALNTERESAEHWREEHQKEQLWRMSTEGHILRELHNILNYDGSAHGQEELEE